MKDLYHPAEPSLFTGRESANRAYLHENIRTVDLRSESTPPTGKVPALFGYACDEGVRRNLGRPGAAEGPRAFRRGLGKLPWLQEAPDGLADAGDIRLDTDRLESAQQAFSEGIAQLLRSGYFPIGIGGGHDIAFAHYKGVRTYLPTGRKLGIVNFDAHFDLRSPGDAPHSGSPFFQIARTCEQEGFGFHYACIGVRRDANPQVLWDRAKELSVLTVAREELLGSALQASLKKLKTFLKRVDAVYLTIDLDGFSSAYAPGVSAASPMGYSPWEMMPLLDAVLGCGKLVSMDLAELNPAFDTDGQTAALAGSLVHRVLHYPGLF
ncbi:formimidoylglutamase [Robiginitalea sp. SC105]|uniref:formimidoylglutamase n=1 Tax=Robiginitalea sp. SC105 TaxID=2762332 RepID=UPI00163B03A7|nr:formimidoylglutamase [Robiginitalea sp. SC105]MBC2838664.1 formimidoylglutamase [Robiginitalea sp. SC105]